MSEFGNVATLVQRLAVLTSAGIPPLSAWRHAASATAQSASVVEGARSANDLPGRLVAVVDTVPPSQRSAWAALAATWWIAAESGAAIAPTLTRLADVLRALEQGARDLDVALAGPQATSRVVLALPGLGVLIGMLLGFDVVGAFLTVPGVICLIVGAILIALGTRWTRRLVRAARDLDATPGLVCDLVAVALAGGGSIPRARATVATACRRVGIDDADASIDEVLTFAASAGVPAGVLLKTEADELRRAARAAAARSVAHLDTSLLFPLGACLLPAFLVLGVVPVGIAVVSSTALAG